MYIFVESGSIYVNTKMIIGLLYIVEYISFSPAGMFVFYDTV